MNKDDRFFSTNLKKQEYSFLSCLQSIVNYANYDYKNIKNFQQKIVLMRDKNLRLSERIIYYISMATDIFILFL